MASTNEEKVPSSSAHGGKPSASSRRSSNRNIKERRHSPKSKTRSSRAHGHSPTTPGAVHTTSSKRVERAKERSSSSKRASSSPAPNSAARKSRPSSSAAITSKPGAVPSSSERGNRKGSSSSRSARSHRPSKTSSTSRASRPSEHKQVYPAPFVPPDHDGPNANTSLLPKDGIVAEAVDDSEMETTTNALRERNRENEALRQELQRTREEQASQSRRHSKSSLWMRLCFGSLILIVGAVVAVLLLTGDDGTKESNEVPTPTNVNTTDGLLDSPSATTCSKISEGGLVDGQEEMTVQPLSVTVSVHVDIDGEVLEILQELLQNVQLLVMPPIAGCGNTTLDTFPIGNAIVDQDSLVLALCEDETDGHCYTMEFPVNLFIKKEVEAYNPEALSNHVEDIFENSTSLLLSAQDENSTSIKDIRSVNSVPVTPSPSTQPSMHPSAATDVPSAAPTLRPTTSAPSASKVTASPTPSLQFSTPGPTESPLPGETAPPTTSTPGPSMAPTLTPSLRPSLSPTTGQPTLAPIPGATPVPSPLPTHGPSISPSSLPTFGVTIAPSFGPSDSPSRAPSVTPTNQPSFAPSFGPTDSPSRAPSDIPTLDTSSAPTTKCTGLESILSRFAPFDGNKALALTWLCSDTWEPPVDAADETALLEERFALGVFYYATNGDGWSNNNGWLTTASVCSWTGIDACNRDGSVTQFGLDINNGSNYGLVGDLPDEMRALTNLERMNFNYNKNLSGSIPSFLSALTKLTRLELADTGRTGPIKSDLWALTQLTALFLNGNFLTGTIPSQIASLTQVELIFLASNDLTGSLPDVIGSMVTLKRLVVNENTLGGAIPALPPSGLTLCRLAAESSNSAYHYHLLRTEKNCFTDTTNALGNCDLSANCS